MVDTDRLHEIGYHAGRNRFVPAAPFIRPRIAEVRQDRGDLAGIDSAAGVGYSQQLDKVFVDRRRRGLNDEDLSAADRFTKLDGYLTIRESAELRSPRVQSPVHEQLRRRAGCLLCRLGL
jgi:hypothetical protein